MSIERPLPANIDAERFLLGSIMLDPAIFEQVSLSADDFSSEPHRKIFQCMGDLHQRDERIDPMAVYAELDKLGTAQACGGLGYLTSLDNGIPQVPNLDGYLRIVQDKALLRKGIFTAQHLINRCFAAEESPGAILLDCQKTLDLLADGNQKHGEWIKPADVVRQYPGGPHKFVSRTQGGVGIATPWAPITETLGGGLHAGELFIVAGRPSMGKSIVGGQLAHTAALKGHGAALFSLEMSKESLTERLLCGITRVDCQKLRAGYLNQLEQNRIMAAAVDLDELPLWIDDTRARTIPAMTSALRKLRAKHPIDVVIVDHLQLMTSAGRRRDPHEDLAEILHELKHEAVKMSLSVVVLSQLNRQCEIDNRLPQLSDLKSTGAAEEDADVVMFVHRPERYAKNHNREDLRAHAEFIIAKQRCGPVGLKNMVFLERIQKFECAVDAGECEAISA